MADGMNRRDFLTVLGVTGAGVATTACGTGHAENFLPYVRPPEDVVPSRSWPTRSGPPVRAAWRCSPAAIAAP